MALSQSKHELHHQIISIPRVEQQISQTYCLHLRQVCAVGVILQSTHTSMFPDAMASIASAPASGVVFFGDENDTATPANSSGDSNVTLTGVQNNLLSLLEATVGIDDAVGRAEAERSRRMASLSAMTRS